MPYSAGVFTRVYSWVARQAANFTMLASAFDTDANDMAAGLSTCVLKDGTQTITADLPMNSHSLTGIRAAVAAGEPVEFAQFNLSGSGQNLLQNAQFLINQRVVSGSVVLTTGQYGHDRWKAGSSGCSYTFSKSGADTTITISAGSLLQIVSLDDIAGGTYTIQNDGTAQGRGYQGAAGGYAANPQQITLTNGTAASIEFTTGTILRPQLVAGGAAKGFARRSYATDLLLCRQYFIHKDLIVQTCAGLADPATIGFDFPQRMRTAPLTSAIDLSHMTGFTSPTVTSTTTDYFAVQVSLGGTRAGYDLQGYWTASCEP